MKDLPKIFANRIDKKIDNNKTLSYGKLMEDKKVQDVDDVRSKLDKLFKSDRNIYSIDCIVTFKDHEEKYTIIGKTDKHLVTKNNTLISISDVYDIELAQ